MENGGGPVPARPGDLMREWFMALDKSNVRRTALVTRRSTMWKLFCFAIPVVHCSLFVLHSSLNASRWPVDTGETNGE
jgi:hypothetical protein